MGKVCFIYDKLLITDNDSAIQMTKTHPLACNCKPGWVSSDPKPPTPSLAIARRGGSFSLRQQTTTSHVGSSSSSASICTHHDNDDNPPPRLQLRDEGGFFFLFFKATNNDEPCRLVVVICLSLHACMPALLVGCTHNDNDKPCRLVVVAPVPGGRFRAGGII